MFLDDNVSKHIKNLIKRYKIPPDIAKRARALGGTQGLELLASWVKEHQGAPQGAASSLSLRQQVEAKAAEFMAKAMQEKGKGEREKRKEELLLKVYPDLAGAAARVGLSSPLRLWHLARALDEEGRGWMRRDELWASWRDLGVTGGRQFRNVKRDGEGVFWTRNDGRLWLHGLERVSKALGVGKLSCDPVLIPATILGEGMKSWRAWLHTAFLKGRSASDNPIARETLAALTGAAPSTQLEYEELTGIVEKKANYAIDGRPEKADVAAQGERLGDLGWDDGATFGWIDEHGKKFWARRLGNTYKVKGLQKAPRGRCRATNHRLTGDLVATWSGQDTDPAQSRGQERDVPVRRGNGGWEGGRLYWRNGRALRRAGRRGEVKIGFLDIGQTKRQKAREWVVRLY